MLLWQWFLVALAAGVFWVGAWRRDARLPVVLGWVYGAMALTCAWQTFFVLQHPERFWQMGLEFAEYAVILGFLHRSAWVKAHLRRV